MGDRRRKDVEWTVADETGSVPTWERVIVAVLMDLRDEMKKFNAVLACPNFQAIPSKLDRIARHTKRKKRPALKVVKRSA